MLVCYTCLGIAAVSFVAACILLVKDARRLDVGGRDGR